MSDEVDKLIRDFRRGVRFSIWFAIIGSILAVAILIGAIVFFKMIGG